MSSGHRAVHLEGNKSSARRRKKYSSGLSDSKGSTGGSSSSSHIDKRKRSYQNSSHDEFKKERPPSFNGERNTGQEVEAWLLGMKKYFQIQNYSGNMKARASIFNLTRREYIWREHLRQVKKMNERNIVWKQFQNYFK